MEDFQEKTDEELVAMSLEDKEVFLILARRYESSLSRYIKRISSFRGDFLEDLLQEIFIKVYINLNAFDVSLKFSSWIYRIAHNEMISYIRKNKKHEEAVFVPDEDLELIASEFHIEKKQFKDDLMESLKTSINELKPKYKDVLVLKFIEDKSYEEISDILEMPMNTVGTQINRAKKQLKEILIKKGIEI